MKSAEVQFMENEINKAIGQVQEYFFWAIIGICLIGIFKLIVIKMVKNKSKNQQMHKLKRLKAKQKKPDPKIIYFPKNKRRK